MQEMRDKWFTWQNAVVVLLSLMWVAIDRIGAEPIPIYRSLINGLRLAFAVIVFPQVATLLIKLWKMFVGSFRD